MSNVSKEWSKFNLSEAEGLTRYSSRVAALKTLYELSDAAYQEREWSDHPYGYDGDLHEAAVFLIEGYGGIEAALEENDIEYIYVSAIGNYLRNKEEADAMYHFARMLWLLREDLQGASNEHQRASPYLPKMRQAAYELLKIMLANDKNDKELVEYIQDYCKEKRIVLLDM